MKLTIRAILNESGEARAPAADLGPTLLPPAAMACPAAMPPARRGSTTQMSSNRPVTPCSTSDIGSSSGLDYVSIEVAIEEWSLRVMGEVADAFHLLGEAEVALALKTRHYCPAHCCPASLSSHNTVS